jgi:hypothetical protein
MFVYVRLIDSQEHQYPKEKPLSNDPRKTSYKIQLQNPEKPNPITIGISKIQRKTEVKKPMFLKTVHRS